MGMGGRAAARLMIRSKEAVPKLKFWNSLLLLLFFTAPLLSGQTTESGEKSAREAGLSLEETMGRLGTEAGNSAELRWDPFFRSGVFTWGDHYAAFETGKPGQEGFVLVDSREILVVPLPYLDKGLLRFPEAFAGALKARFDALTGDDAVRFRIAAIIVDPGHGGKDSGAVGTHHIAGKTLRAVEKDIVLKTALMLHSRLAGAFPDKQVLLTRRGDSYPSLEDRVALANSVHLRENEAIIFISIHANASFNKNARGYEVWYLSPEYRRNVIDQERYAGSAEVIPILNAMLEEEFTTESIIMAQSIIKGIDETLGKSIPSRGIKAEEWFVVRNARMPSVLVELGFVTNQEDALLLTSDAHLRNFSEALYKGIVDFIAIFEGSGGFIGLP